MVNITHKNTTLRKAIASAELKVSMQETIHAIQNKKVPKGDVFEFSRAAGLLAVKKTSDMIPDCHPMPVEYTAITYRIEGLSVFIIVEVHTIYRTGVEVEAMHGAAITALTIYDMLKPIDKAVEIGSIKLLSKEGGKSDKLNSPGEIFNCAVIVCSDSISKGQSQDTAGKLIIEMLKPFGIKNIAYEIIPDEAGMIRSRVLSFVEQQINLIILTGGTGLSFRDVTPEAVSTLIETPIPGIMEAYRHYGQERMPYAMLSRGVSGFIQNSLVLTLPGSEKAVEEGINALFPQILHAFKVRSGSKHS